MITIKFKLHGETRIPRKVLKDAPRSGPFDSYADWIRSEYRIDCSESDAIKHLKSYGAWDDDDLKDHDANLDRLIWVAVMDCIEQNSNYFYMGE